MKTATAPTETRDETNAESKCLVRSMAAAFREEPALEAVRH